MRTTPFRLTPILIALALAAPPAAAQVLRIAELNAEQIRALDRAKTDVLLPGGIRPTGGARESDAHAA